MFFSLSSVSKAIYKTLVLLIPGAYRDAARSTFHLLMLIIPFFSTMARDIIHSGLRCFVSAGIIIAFLPSGFVKRDCNIFHFLE